MRWWVVLLLAANFASADSLYLDESFRDSTRPTLQALAAIALRSAPVDWGAMTGIAGCTTPSPSAEPGFKILPLDANCVARIPEIFCRIGRGCQP